MPLPKPTQKGPRATKEELDYLYYYMQNYQRVEEKECLQFIACVACGWLVIFGFLFKTFVLKI